MRFQITDKRQLQTAGGHSGGPRPPPLLVSVYLQQQLRRRVGGGHSGGHGGADSVQLLDLPAPDLDQPRAVPLHPSPAGPRTIHAEGQLCSLRQQSGKTWKDNCTCDNVYTLCIIYIFIFVLLHIYFLAASDLSCYNK